MIFWFFITYDYIRLHTSFLFWINFYNFYKHKKLFDDFYIYILMSLESVYKVVYLKKGKDTL